MYYASIYNDPQSELPEQLSPKKIHNQHKYGTTLFLGDRDLKTQHEEADVIIIHHFVQKGVSA